MGLKRTPLEKSIIAALHVHGTPEAAAEAIGISLEMVLSVQRANQVTEDADGPHSMERKLKSAYGGYWRQWQEAHPESEAPAVLSRPKPKKKGLTIQPRRQLRMVPDDRHDEEIDFETMMNAITGGIMADGRKQGGDAA